MNEVFLLISFINPLLNSAVSAQQNDIGFECVIAALEFFPIQFVCNTPCYIQCFIL